MVVRVKEEYTLVVASFPPSNLPFHRISTYLDNNSSGGSFFKEKMVNKRF